MKRLYALTPAAQISTAADAMTLFTPATKHLDSLRGGVRQVEGQACLLAYKLAGVTQCLTEEWRAENTSDRKLESSTGTKVGHLCTMDEEDGAHAPDAYRR